MSDKDRSGGAAKIDSALPDSAADSFARSQQAVDARSSSSSGVVTNSNANSNYANNDLANNDLNNNDLNNNDLNNNNLNTINHNTINHDDLNDQIHFTSFDEPMNSSPMNSSPMNSLPNSYNDGPLLTEEFLELGREGDDKGRKWAAPTVNEDLEEEEIAMPYGRYGQINRLYLWTWRRRR
jgi:hypothetical protein